MRPVRLITSLLIALVSLAACGEAGAPRLRLATTTSTENSGLLAYLLPEFERQAGVEVQVVAVGTGKALKLGERGDADVVLVHAREREDEFLAAGHATERRDVMWNDFVVLGPVGDPAGVRGIADPAEALRKIHAAGGTFVSRGDDSGTHIREVSMWKRAGVTPRENAEYYEAGQGMGACLTIADEKQGYVLADRGTYLAFRKRIDLEVLVEGRASLRNPYGVLLVNAERHPHVNAAAARELADFLTSDEGQRRIAAFRKDGEVLFHPVDADAEAGE